MHPIIDTHQHLWDLDRFELPWLDGAPALKRSYRTQDYLSATAESNVAKAVYMEVDVAVGQKEAEADYIIALCAQNDNPTCAAVISGDPGRAGFDEYVAKYASASAIKGMRQVLHAPDLPAGYCLTPQFMAGVQLLGRVGLRYDVCLRPGELGDAVTLAEQCPETTLILDHCGNADPYIVNGMAGQEGEDEEPLEHTREQWMNDISELGRHSNVVCKISGIVARARPGWQPADLAPTVNHCLDSFGPDRVIFGGDWPVCTLGASYGEWAASLREIISVRSDAVQRKLLFENAEALYDLASR